MLAIALSSGFFFHLCMTSGLFFTKFAKLPANYTERVLLGLVAANTLTAFVSLFFPINGVTASAILICSLLPLYMVRNEFKQLLSALAAKKHILLWSLPFIAIACVAALGPPRAYDTGLYHLQTIKWIEEYAVVPGLANLHGRFGFNPNIFTFYALTSLTDLFKQEIFPVNVSLYSILVLYFINRIHTIFKRDGITNILVFNLVIFIDIIFTLSNVSSPSPNFITAVLPFFIFADTLAPGDPSVKTGLLNYVPVAVLCVYILTAKLATLPLMLLLLLILVKYCAERRTILWLLAGLTVIMIPWLTRNIILSGWLIYPFPSLDLFSPDWKVPLAAVVEEKMHVTGWARNPGSQHLIAAQMSMSQWFPIWWQRIFIEHKILFIASLVSPLAVLVRVVTRKESLDFHACAVTATALLGVIFWLMLAPAMAFGEPFLAVAAASPLLFWQFRLQEGKTATVVTKALYVVIIVLLALHTKKITRFDFGQIAYKPMTITIPPEVGFQSSASSGTKIYVPTSGDRCFDHPIPCTPYPDSTVALRGPTLQSGFNHSGKNMAKPDSQSGRTGQ